MVGIRFAVGVALGPPALGPLQLTVKGRRRCSAAVGYLNPVKSRPNLRIEVNALSHKVLMEGKRAVGVR